MGVPCAGARWRAPMLPVPAGGPDGWVG
jgi:hypothetical protein